MKKQLLTLFLTALLACIGRFAGAQGDLTIRGRVTDAANNEGLPGVNVLLKGSQKGTTTDRDGNYSLVLVDRAAILVFSFVGYEAQELAVGSQTQLNVRLKATAGSLDEVVVVGYGTQSRRNVTGSVAKVDMKQTENLPNTNITQSLRGRVAGVQFLDNGRPGQGGSILVRGRRSISAGNDPLIVLDGVFYNGSLADINPNDIESMEVLKDASAAAIYGSRAANGVILITSKRGKTDKPAIRVNGFYGVSDWSYKPKLLSPERYIQKTLDFRRQTGLPVDPTQTATYLQPTEGDNYRAGRTIDPWDVISQQASIQSYDLSISGQSGRTNYFVSGAYTNEKGLIFNDNAKRYALRLNLENDITDWLAIGINSQFTVRDLSGTEADTYAAYQTSPYAQLFFDEAGTDPVPVPTGLATNPLFNALRVKNLEVNENLFANLYAKVSLPFVKGLSYRLNYSPNFRWSRLYNFQSVYQRNGINNTGTGSKRDGRAFDWVLENILTYSRQFGQNHDFDATLLYGRNHFGSESTTATGSNFTGVSDVLGWNNLSLAQVQSTTSDASQIDAISSMLRLNYRFKNRYLLTMTARRDASSVFSAGNKYATFPSAALAWIASEEPFIRQLSFVDLLKVRLSYGAVGNQAISAYQTLDRGGTTQYVFGDGGPTSTGIFTSGIGNANLKWETTYSKNAAIDFELFKGRLGGTVEYYDMATKDLILSRALPSPTGFASILDNLGEVNNKGLEVTLNTLNVARGKFEWSSSLVFSTNKNKIVHLYNSDLNKDGIEDSDVGNQWFIGQPVQVNFDYAIDGVYQEGDQIPTGYRAGFIRLKDVNSDGQITADDRIVQSQREARYRWGITNNIRWGNLSLSVFINAMQDFMSPVSGLNTFNPNGNFPDKSANFLDADWWTPENKSNTRPSLAYTNPILHSYYVSRDFVRVQDVSLAYQFPKPLVSRLKLGSLRAYVSGKNLLTFTDWPNFDPESGYSSLAGGFPTPRSVVAGLNLSF